MAVELAWKIVTLVPPALVCLPKEYNEDCMERRYTAWSDEAPSCPTIYFKPVLFYSALGHRHREIKGIVGNKINQNTMKIVKCMLLVSLQILLYNVMQFELQALHFPNYNLIIIILLFNYL